MTASERAFDVVVGHGAAGLAAALSAAEAGGGTARVLVIERAPEDASGGNTRWSPAYMRLEAPDRRIFDRSLYDIPNVERAICTDQPPVTAKSIRELALALGIDADATVRTIDAYNAAAAGNPAHFDFSRTDGMTTRGGFVPPKSNWARRIERAPFVAYPLVCAICYTFGGIETDAYARVIGAAGPIAGLFAAGEITGQFYKKAPGGTSVLRGLVFGRIAGARAIASRTGDFSFPA